MAGAGLPSTPGFWLLVYSEPVLLAGLVTATCSQVLGLKRTASRARGIADSMEGGPAFEMPSRYVCAAA